jgi:hypothetical protein
VRGSPTWIDSSNRLDALNDRIMHDSTFEPQPPDEPGGTDAEPGRPSRPH